MRRLLGASRTILQRELNASGPRRDAKRLDEATQGATRRRDATEAGALASLRGGVNAEDVLDDLSKVMALKMRTR